LRAYAVLTALAEAALSEGDRRSLDQRRVDALVDALMNVLALFDAKDVRHRCAHPEHDHSGPTTTAPPTAEDGSEDAAAGSTAEPGQCESARVAEQWGRAEQRGRAEQQRAAEQQGAADAEVGSSECECP
jgi:hypothetical protein